MTPVVSTTALPSTPETVWPLLSSPAEFARWQTTHLGFRGDVPADLVAGVSFVEQVQVMGMPAEVTWTVLELIPQSRLSLTGRGPLGVSMHSSIDVEAAGTGSVVTLSQEVSGSAVAALGGQLTHELRREQERSLARLLDATTSGIAG